MILDGVETQSHRLVNLSASRLEFEPCHKIDRMRIDRQ